MKSLWKTFKQGIIYENPLLMLMIGLCSALAVTSSVANGLGMGLAMTFVLLFSEIVISLFRKVIPNSVRIPIFIIIIAAFTTMVDLVMKAYFPDLSKSMGVFIPLIVVNCIYMGRVEAFASKQKLMPAIFDSLGMGLGYTWVMIAISACGSFWVTAAWPGFRYAGFLSTHSFFILPPGGFLVFDSSSPSTSGLRQNGENSQGACIMELAKIF
jgi:electron transport complex protein RnfE